jgi:outer membrane protein TolC
MGECVVLTEAKIAELDRVIDRSKLAAVVARHIAAHGSVEARIEVAEAQIARLKARIAHIEGPTSSLGWVQAGQEIREAEAEIKAWEREIEDSRYALLRGIGAPVQVAA